MKAPRLRHLFHITMGQTILYEDLTEDGLPVYSATAADVYFGLLRNPSLLLDRGDLVVGARGSIGFPKLVRERCTSTQTTIALRRRDTSVDSRFVRYWMLANSEDVFWFDKTAVPQLTTSRLGDFRIPLPSSSEQSRIANFLDEQTARIDALIAEKGRLRRLLELQSREAVDQAVLGSEFNKRGAALRNLTELGPLPDGWVASRLKYELEYVTSGSRGWADFYTEDGALFVRIGNLTRDSIELDLSDVQRVTLPNVAEGVRALVRPGDLLISITAYLGSVAVAPQGIEEAYVSQHVSLARPNRTRATPKWLGYVVLSSVGKTFFDLQAYGGTKVQLSLEDIRELPVPLPSMDIQRIRIAELESRLNHLKAMSHHVDKHIDRLREYRSSLISAAVTGQLDISSFKPKLPEAA